MWLLLILRAKEAEQAHLPAPAEEGTAIDGQAQATQEVAVRPQTIIAPPEPLAVLDDALTPMDALHFGQDLFPCTLLALVGITITT